MCDKNVKIEIVKENPYGLRLGEILRARKKEGDGSPFIYDAGRFQFSEDEACVVGEDVQSSKVRTFINALITVCRNAGFSISHEDQQGAFIIEKFEEDNVEWLRNAFDNTICGYEEGEISPDKDPLICPLCRGKASQTCMCPRLGSGCNMSHEWHTCVVHKIKVLGSCDHSIPHDVCTCGRDKKDESLDSF